MRFEQRHRRWYQLAQQRQQAQQQAQRQAQLGGDEEQVIGPALLDDTTVHLVLDLALRIGEVQMSSGAGAADVTATILAVAAAYELPHSEVDVIFTSITASCHRGSEAAPVTALRVVRSRSLDYTRLAAVEALVRRITAGRIGVEDATAELGRITGAAHPYPRWVATVAWAGMAASVALLLGGDGLIASLAALITALIDRVGRLLNRRGLPFFFQQLVGGALATGCSIGIIHSGLFGPGAHPSLLIASAITVLLSGLSVVSAVQDAISGYNVTAAGRSMEIALMSAGLIAGVVLALNVAVALGLPPTALDDVSTSPLHLPVQVLAGAGAAASFALACYSGVRELLVSAAAGAIGAACYGVLALSSVDQITGSAIAAAVIGFGGGVMARRLRIPPLVVAVSGLVPLLPGLTTYRALYELAVERYTGGLPDLMIAIGIALALAAGVVLGEYLGQPVRTGLGRLERRLAGPRLAGPLNPSKRRLE